jgi:hypothetical protein
MWTFISSRIEPLRKDGENLRRRLVNVKIFHFQIMSAPAPAEGYSAARALVRFISTAESGIRSFAPGFVQLPDAAPDENSKACVFPDI